MFALDSCAECDEKASCVFNDETSDYECVCHRAYRGDGKRCVRRDCREDESMCHPEGGLCWHDKAKNISICRCNYGFRGELFGLVTLKKMLVFV